jgi:hypothetical protein
LSLILYFYSLATQTDVERAREQWESERAREREERERARNAKVEYSSFSDHVRDSHSSYLRADPQWDNESIIYLSTNALPNRTYLLPSYRMPIETTCVPGP